MQNESTTLIHSDRRARARTSRTEAPDGLDWQGFSARHFPGRRRHDLDALTAYATYRRRSPLSWRAGREGVRADGPAHSDDVVLLAAAAAAWEAEGGSVL
jgi:hypothetical protein